MKKMMILAACVAAVCMVLVVACGGEKDPADALETAAGDMKKAGDDLAVAVDDVVDGAGSDVAGAVQGTIDEIKAALAEKESELKALKDKLASMSPTELTGKEAGDLKSKSEALMTEIKKLKEKLAAALN